MAVDPVSLAITAALTAAQMAIQASTTIEGQRLQDLDTTVADYGTPLNYFYNRRWLTCPCFYSEKIRERKKKRKTKGGKYTEYTYFGTWAIHIADHPIYKVRKIKFDGNLVYDIDAAEPLYELDEDYELSSNMRIYYGSDTQMPDPRMQTTVEDFKGAGTCPAYRGQSYIFFEDIPLEKLGNRLPVVSMEVENLVGELGGNVVLDFVNENYRIGDETFLLSELIEPAEHSGSDFDWTDIIPGTGWVTLPNGRASSIANLTPMVAEYLGLNSTIEATFEFFIDIGNSDSPDKGAGFYLKKIGAAAPTNELGAEVWITNGDDAFSVYSLVDGAVGPYPSISGLVNGTDYTATISISNTNASITLPPGTSNGSHPSLTPAYIAMGPFIMSPGVLPASTAVIKRITFTGTGSSVNRLMTLEEILNDVAERAGADPSDYDFSACAGISPAGYNWTQGKMKQVVDPLRDVYDFDIRPHDFGLQALLRGSTPTEVLSDFAVRTPRYEIVPAAESDLPLRMYFNYADYTIDQQTNTAVSQRKATVIDSARELTLDLTTMTFTPSDAKQYSDRYFRRKHFNSTEIFCDLTRRDIHLEPGDVRTLDCDGELITAVLKRLTYTPAGKLLSEWNLDEPEIALLSGAAGAGASGQSASVILSLSNTAGEVMDLPMLVDSHDSSSPFTYIAAGPSEADKAWPGASFAQSDTGEEDTFAAEWGGIAGTDYAEIGVATNALNDVPAHIYDTGSLLTVVIGAGYLSSTTYEELLEDPTLNLALVGNELVQFTTATLVADYTYELTGFLRGLRGTEWASTGHATNERFVLLETAKKRVMGASEIGDTDSYIVSTVGRTPQEADAFAVAYTGASHKPYSPVYGEVTQSGADLVFNATRRTRLGAATLNGQDVPLGESSEAYELDIMDGSTVVRTITSTSLPITYTEADQITDWGSAQSSITANLYQMNPTLSLRGYPLAMAL